MNLLHASLLRSFFRLPSQHLFLGVIYDGEARDPVEGVEVFEFMLGIGAHEPHGFADFAGRPADYFAAVFAAHTRVPARHRARCAVRAWAVRVVHST
jgi:hypothetical protein